VFSWFRFEREERDRAVEVAEPRGLLELDLVFEQILGGRGIWRRRRRGARTLLAMADNDLLDLVMGRAETKDPEIRAMVEVLRAA
jgi:succinate dehydrogenase flavin-adding protein (antitoxin of CptAB toxin-antitoxin module)